MKTFNNVKFEASVEWCKGITLKHSGIVSGEFESKKALIEDIKIHYANEVSRTRKFKPSDVKVKILTA